LTLSSLSRWISMTPQSPSHIDASPRPSQLSGRYRGLSVSLRNTQPSLQIIALAAKPSPVRHGLRTRLSCEFRLPSMNTLRQSILLRMQQHTRAEMSWVGVIHNFMKTS
jgi:hypothetical protein